MINRKFCISLPNIEHFLKKITDLKMKNTIKFQKNFVTYLGL